MEDDQGSTPLPIGGSRDNASTDNYLYMPAEPAGKAAPQWDIMEDDSRTFNMTYNYQGAIEATPRSSNHAFSDIPTNQDTHAFGGADFAALFQSDTAEQEVASASASANDLWYAHHVETNSPHNSAYGNDASTILAYNHALSNFLASNESTRPNLPVDVPVEMETTPTSRLQPASEIVYGNRSGIPAPAYFQNMNYGSGVFTNSASEHYRYPTATNVWEN